jgi:arylsulfatase A-like enzyme
MRLKKVIYLLLLLPLFSFSCKKTPVTSFKVYRFIDHLTRKNISHSPFLQEKLGFPVEFFVPLETRPLLDLGSGENPFGLKKKLRVGGSEFNIIFSPPKSRYRYDLVLPQNGILEFGTGVIRDKNFEKLQKSSSPKRDGVSFLITLEMNGMSKIIFQKYHDLPPSKEERTAKFSFHKINLPPQEQRARLILTTEGEEGSFSFWYNPVLFSEGSNDRNVILISIDTLRADHLGCYGYKKETSPTIDSLAQDSALFLNTYSSSPWTLPAHVSLLTSLFGVNHQVYYEKETIDPKILTLADVLRQNHFFCSAFTGEGFVSSIYGFSKGFDSYREGEGGVHLQNSAELVSSQVSEWLESNRNKNFFLFIHTFQPHDPYDSPPPYNTMFLGENPSWTNLDLLQYLGGSRGIYKRLSENQKENLIGLYDGEIRYVDDGLIKPLIQKLKEMNLYGQTMIVFTSDHGEEFYDHGGWTHGQDLYDESLKVPLLIKFPESNFKGKKIESIVRLIDIMPTILDEMGIDSRTLELDGQSLVPVLKGKEKGDRIFLADRGANVMNSNVPQRRAINQGRYKLILNKEPSPEDLAFFLSPPPLTPSLELYKLDNDPHERENRVRDYSRLVNQMVRIINDIYKKGKKRKPGETVIDENVREQLRALGYIR